MEVIVAKLLSRDFRLEKIDNTGEKKWSVLDEKHFRRCDKYDGSESKWTEWLFNLQVAVGRASNECFLALDHLMKNTPEEVKAGVLNDVVTTEVRTKYTGELLGILCELTTGEANVVVRSIIDKGLGYCGFGGLVALKLRFNPKTPTRILQQLIGVISPPQVKDLRFVAKAIEDWEAKKAKLKMDHDESFTEQSETAIMLKMMPKELQDMAFQMTHSGSKLKYAEVRDKLIGVSSNRISLSTPTPMDIGQVGGGGGEHECTWWGCDDAGGDRDGEEEWHVNAMGKGQCHRCGGLGHFARECASPAEKGKGGGKGDAKAGKGGQPWTYGG
jgi:hypothetical protein